MKKKILAWLVGWVLIFSTVSPHVFAADTPGVSVKAAVLMEASTGRILYEKNAAEHLPMASTTKILTALLALEQPELDKEFVVDKAAIQVEGTSMGLTEGAVATLRALATGMLLASGNDAANAAAVRISGSIPEFVTLMNRRAAELGMTETSFETPSGLDGKNHYSTAHDMACLARAALANPEFRAICSLKSTKLSLGNPPATYWLSNHNRLLKDYPGCIGVKTGFTKKAGRCLVSAAERGDVTLICVTLCAPNDWQDHTQLLDWGFPQIAPVPDQTESVFVPVTGGDTEVVRLIAPAQKICARTAEISRIIKLIEVPPFVYAPIKEGARLGEVHYYLDGKVYSTVPLLAERSVERQAPAPKPGFFERFFAWWRHPTIKKAGFERDVALFTGNVPAPLKFDSTSRK